MSEMVADIKTILMKRKVCFMRHTLFLLNIFIVQISFTQTPINGSAQEKYRVVQWGADDGLSAGNKKYMLKDAKGFLWVSSISGVSRFDGKTFKNYFIGFAAYPLVEDSLHNIWIGTNDGIWRYDIKADTFSNFKSYPDSNQGSSHCYPFQATKNEVYVVHIWSLTIYAFNVHTLEKKVLIKLDPSEPVDLNNNPEQSIIYDERTKSLWMSEGFEDKPGGGLFQISLSTGKREHFTWPCFKKMNHHPHLSQGMCFDRKRNCLWLNTKDGLMQFTIDDKRIHHINALNEWVNLKDYNFLDHLGITLDLHNRVWVSTHPKGIFIYDPVTQSTSIPRDPKLENAISEAACSIYCDRDGIIWSSGENIRQLIPFVPAVIHYDSKTFHSQIQNMVLADNGRILLGGWSGLYSFDPVSGSITMLKNGLNAMGIGYSNFPMMIDTIHQKAWIGVEHPWGINEMDIPSLAYRPLTFKDISGADMIPGRINYLLSRPFRNGFLFVMNNKGIFYVNKDSLVAQQVLNIPQNIYSMVLADDKYLNLFCDGSVKYLTYANKNNKWIRTANPLDSIGWANIFYDKVDQTYWVSTFNQLLFHYNSNFKRLRTYTEKDGLPAQSFVQIVSDNTGNIWLANLVGMISELNIKTGQFTSLSEKDGYQKNFFGYACPFTEDANGDLYFSGNTGIDKVSPGKFISAPPSSVYLQSLEVNQKAISTATGVNNLTGLALKYFQNSIYIETGIIDYYSKGNSRIRYKLEGLNDNWQYAPDYYTIRYDGLQPKKYRLVIQASNATNEFNGPEKFLVIKISPAFWNTWWFRIAAITSMATLFYGLIRWRLKQKFQLKLEQSEKEKQIAELKQNASELEMQALRSQMNPHFIFNSLNSINMFILENNKLQASDYLSKFSRLVRLILQNSRDTFIPLERELEALRLYLELESLRFQDKFEYTISVGDEVDTGQVEVAPLIIQPYVENAIWHGLIPKKGKGHVGVEVYQQEKILFCKISDDGIGRKEASAKKSRTNVTNKSMGMRITADRIALLQQQKDNNTFISITDLVLADGTPGGTEVLIKIPVHYVNGIIIDDGEVSNRVPFSSF
jgi:ligand-binding sensor domain-containing protein